MVPSGSAEALPLRVTPAVALVVVAFSVWSGPALAHGSRFWPSQPPAMAVSGVVLVVRVMAKIRMLGVFGSVNVLAPGGRSRRYLNR